jgi:hypothetical protein
MSLRSDADPHDDDPIAAAVHRQHPGFLTIYMTIRVIKVATAR